MEKQEYEEWVNKVSKFILEEGKKLDIAYGAMQSVPFYDSEVNLFMLGHDAHEGGSFPKETKLEDITKRFYEGHPRWELEHENWAIFSNLKNAFKGIECESLMEEKFFFTNAVFFTGDKINSVNNILGKSVSDSCFEFTRELVFEIVKPKVVLCCSLNEVFYPLIKPLKEATYIKREYMPDGSKHKIVIAEYKGIKIIGIPHPSGAHGVKRSLPVIAKIIKNAIGMASLNRTIKRCDTPQHENMVQPKIKTSTSPNDITFPITITKGTSVNQTGNSIEDFWIQFVNYSENKVFNPAYMDNHFALYNDKWKSLKVKGKGICIYLDVTENECRSEIYITNSNQNTRLANFNKYKNRLTNNVVARKYYNNITTIGVTQLSKQVRKQKRLKDF